MFSIALKSLGVSFFISIFPFWGISQSWNVTRVADLPMAVSNNAVTGAIVNGKQYVYSFGGIDTLKTYNGIHLKCFRYDVTANTWDTLPDLPDTLGKIAMSAANIDSIIYIFGGYHVFAGGGEISSNKVHRFNVNTNTFTTDGTSIPVAIDDHVQCIWKDSLIFIVTGWSNTTNVPNVQIYDAKNDSWLTGTSVPNNGNYTSFGASGTIINDTLYYFGGASTSWNFPAQPILRKGYINPTNPTQINWTHSVPNAQIKGYRSACTYTANGPHWLGGSSVTYNYNGIAYNGSGGVSPENRNLHYDINQDSLYTIPLFGESLPMDLRGIAEFNDGSKFIVGGMEANQKVSSKTLLLFYSPASIHKLNKTEVNVFPNPTTSSFNIKEEKVTQVNIYDVKGCLMNSFSLNTNGYDITDFNTGYYWVEVIFSDGKTVKQKILKK